MEDEFAEAMLPLAEITDEKERIELTKEILTYVAKMMAVHNKRLDDAKIKEALKPVFQERTKNMVMTIFEEKYYAGFAEGETKAEQTRKPMWVAEGEARGKAEGKAEGVALSILLVLQARFKTIPMKLQKRLLAVTDLTLLESLTRQAAVCPSLKDFEKLLGK